MLDALRGATVVLTREPEDNARLAARLQGVAREVIELPCLTVRRLEDVSVLRASLARLDARDWVVVTSRHGADALARCLPFATHVAAVGAATAERLQRAGIAVQFVATRPDGAHLARELPAAGARVLLARSDRALPDLPRILRERGCTIEEAVAYRTTADVSGDTARVHEAIANGENVALLFFSPSAVEGFVSALSAAPLAHARIFAAGDATLRSVLAHQPAAAVSTFDEEVMHVAHR